MKFKGREIIDTVNSRQVGTASNAEKAQVFAQALNDRLNNQKE